MKLKAYKKKRRMTIQELAEMVGCSHRTMCNYLHDDRVIRKNGDVWEIVGEVVLWPKREKK